MGAATPVGDSKPRRSRDGCQTCRGRQKKCDGARPLCKTCLRLGLACAGYKIEILWEDDARREGMRKRGPSRRRLDFRSFQHSDHSSGNVFKAPKQAAQAVARVREDGEANKRPEMMERPRTLLSLHPGQYNPARSFLWDQYINRFCQTFPSHSGPRTPFLSILVPMALQSVALREALIAVSGAQTWRSTSPELHRETLTARQNALTACRVLLNDSRWSHIGQDPRGSPFYTIDLVLVNLLATVTMLLLYEKFTGEGEENWSPHLRCMSVIYASVGSLDGSCPFHEAMQFLHGLFAYNDLVGSTSLRQPPLSTYYIEAGKTPQTSRESDAGKRRGLYHFPSMIARISSGDASVTRAGIASWDGRMDWFPSFCLGGNNGLSSPEESVVVELYRTTAMIYCYQQSWRREGTDHARRAASDVLFREHQRAIDLIRSIPTSSSFENALLWPISIVGPDLQSQFAAERRYLSARLAGLEERFQMKQFHCMQRFLLSVWTRMDRVPGADGEESILLLQG